MICFPVGNKEMIISAAKVHIIFRKSKRFSRNIPSLEKKSGKCLGILKKSVNFAPGFERKVGRVNDRAGLEIRYTLLGIGGLNPSPSANMKKAERSAGNHTSFSFLFMYLPCIYYTFITHYFLFITRYAIKSSINSRFTLFNND